MEKKTYIIAFHEQGEIIPETYETIAFARECGQGTLSVVVLAWGGEIGGLTDRLAQKTGLPVIGLEGNDLTSYCAEAYVTHLAAFFQGKGTVIVCMPHTSTGSDFAPQLSVRIHADCITAIESMKDGVFQRGMYGGRFRAHHVPAAASAVLTVMPGSWKHHDLPPESLYPPKIIPVPDGQVSTKTRGTRESAYANAALTEAEVVVSAGRGVGKAENIAKVKALSALFPRSALGSSRAVCDLGWLDYSHQIGSTGNKVAPKLYIACGISGALQHIAGMKDSRMVIAINTDPAAPIFGVALYGIVEDVNTFIPLLIDEYLKGAKKG